MRAKEFVHEGKKGTMHSHHVAAAQGAYKFRDDGTDRIYTLTGCKYQCILFYKL